MVKPSARTNAGECRLLRPKDAGFLTLLFLQELIKLCLWWATGTCVIPSPMLVYTASNYCGYKSCQIHSVSEVATLGLPGGKGRWSCWPYSTIAMGPGEQNNAGGAAARFAEEAAAPDDSQAPETSLPANSSPVHRATRRRSTRRCSGPVAILMGKGDWSNKESCLVFC